MLQVSYAIGITDPLSVYLDTRGSAEVDENKLLRIVKEMFDLTPAGIIRQLNLQNPIYLPTAAYGHFGRTPDNAGHFTWEKMDKVEELKKCF